MKKWILALALFLVIPVTAFASVQVFEDGVEEGHASSIDFSTSLNGVFQNGRYTVTVDPLVLTSLSIEGTADDYETTITAVDPTADQTASFPNFAVNYAVMGSTLTTNNVGAANSIWFVSNGMVLEGATADASEMTISPADVAVDVAVTLPTSAAAVGVFYTALTTNSVDVANSITGTSNGFIAEGATADGFETTVAFADPGADFTLTIPASTAAASPLLTALTTNAVDVANSVTGASNSLIFEGATADGFETTVAPTDVTADATVTLPTKTGTLHNSGAAVALTPGATPTLTVVAGSQIFTYQPADNTDATFNASGTGSAGDEMTFIFTTDAAGSGDEVMTFGTNMHSTGTLTMANLASDIYVVCFVSNGTKWVETSRTAVQTT